MDAMAGGKSRAGERPVKILVISIERTEYTLDLIRNVYEPRGVEVKFLDEVGWRDLLHALKTHDALVVNSYSDFKCVALLLLNGLFFRRPMGIDADSQLRIPTGWARRWFKSAWLGWLFARKWCWGFAGGTVSHREFYRHYGMDEQRIRLMPMMVDNARFICAATKAPSSVCRFGYVGRLVAHKNVDVAIRSLALLRDEGIAVQLDIVGRGPEKGRLCRLVASAGLEKSVHFRGYLEGASKIQTYREMDCLVLPSRYEPWGLVVNEALASGTPVVVSDSVGARFDLVEGCGFVVKTGDVGSLADAMRKMAKDINRRQAMGARGLARMREWDYNLYRKCWDGWIAEL